MVSKLRIAATFGLRHVFQDSTYHWHQRYADVLAVATKTVLAYEVCAHADLEQMYFKDCSFLFLHQQRNFFD
jgi:hypothetical protein